MGSIFGIIKKRNVPESEQYKVTTNFSVIIFVTMIVGIVEIVLSLILIVGCHKVINLLYKSFHFKPANILICKLDWSNYSKYYKGQWQIRMGILYRLAYFIRDCFYIHLAANITDNATVQHGDADHGGLFRLLCNIGTPDFCNIL